MAQKAPGVAVLKRRYFLAAFASAACSRAPQQKGTLRVATALRITHAPVHLADELGYFKEGGLSINFIDARNARDSVVRLAAGEVDVAELAFNSGVANTIAKGTHIRIVAGRDQIAPNCGDSSTIYFRHSRFPKGIDDANAWKGAKVALPESQVVEFYLDSILEKKGIAPDSISRIRSSGAQALSSAIAGQIDLFFAFDGAAYLPAGIPTTLGTSTLVTDLLGNRQYTHVLFGPKLVDGDESVGAAYLRAYLKGVRAYAAGQAPKFLDKVASETGLDRGRMQSACRGNVSTDGSIRNEDLKALMDWAINKGYVTQPMRIGQLVDTRFLQALQK